MSLLRRRDPLGAAPGDKTWWFLSASPFAGTRLTASSSSTAAGGPSPLWNELGLAGLPPRPGASMERGPLRHAPLRAWSPRPQPADPATALRPLPPHLAGSLVPTPVLQPPASSRRVCLGGPRALLTALLPLLPLHRARPARALARFPRLPRWDPDFRALPPPRTVALLTTTAPPTAPPAALGRPVLPPRPRPRAGRRVATCGRCPRTPPVPAGGARGRSTRWTDPLALPASGPPR